MKRADPDVFSQSKRPKRQVPYEFVLEQLASLDVTTRAMFGSTAVYLGEQVVFILRRKGDRDDGVWVAFEPDREVDVYRALPNLTAIDLLPNARGWRVLRAASETFEDDVLKACALLRRDDAPIGKVPTRLKAKRRAESKVPVKRSVVGRQKAPKARKRASKARSA